MRKLYQDKELLEKEYIDLKRSTYEIADIYNVSQTTINRWLRKYNIHIRNPSEFNSISHNKEFKLYKNTNWLKYQYIALRKSAVKIGVICECTGNNILYWLKKFNIPVRTKTEFMKGRSLSEKHKENISKALKGKYLGEKSSFYGKHHTKETKRKISLANKGKKVSIETRERISKAHKGKIISEETRRKLSIAHKGKKLSEETKGKISLANKGKKVSIETRERIRKSHKGKKLSENTKKKISKSIKGKKNPFYGKHHTEETKRKLSEQKKGKKIPPFTKEHKENISKSLKGKYIGEKNHLYGKSMPEEIRKKISLANKGRIVSEETREKISKAHKGKKLSEETRRKLSIARTGSKNHMWNPNREEVYSPYGPNFYDRELRNIKWSLQNGRDMLTGEKLDSTSTSAYHHIDYDKTNDDPDNHCLLTISNHTKITNNQRYNPIKAEYYTKQLQVNTRALKDDKVPKSWKSINKLLFKQEKGRQLELIDFIKFLKEGVI